MNAFEKLGVKAHRGVFRSRRADYCTTKTISSIKAPQPHRRTLLTTQRYFLPLGFNSIKIYAFRNSVGNPTSGRIQSQRQSYLLVNTNRPLFWTIEVRGIKIFSLTKHLYFFFHKSFLSLHFCVTCQYSSVVAIFLIGVIMQPGYSGYVNQLIYISLDVAVTKEFCVNEMIVKKKKCASFSYRFQGFFLSPRISRYFSGRS